MKLRNIMLACTLVPFCCAAFAAEAEPPSLPGGPRLPGTPVRSTSVPARHVVLAWSSGPGAGYGALSRLFAGDRLGAEDVVCEQPESHQGVLPCLLTQGWDIESITAGHAGGATGGASWVFVLRKF